MNERPQIPCTNCNGAGSQAMPDKYWRVLTFLRRKRSATSSDVHALEPEASPVLANKRLEYLRAHGFETRTLQQDSKTKPFWIYKPV